MSLIVVIGLVWIGLLVVTVAFCAAAGSADRRETMLAGVRRPRRGSARYQPRSAPARAAQARSAQAQAEAHAESTPTVRA